MSNMTFAYVGNFKPPFSTENDIKATLESMGFGVVTLQEDDIAPEQIRAAALQADALLWTMTWPHKQDLAYTVETVEMLKAKGIPSIGYHLDLFFGLDRGGRDYAKEPMFYMEHLFSPSGDHEESFANLGTGVQHHYLPPGVLEASCYLGRKRAAYAHLDVAFVGSEGYHPEWPHRPRLLAELRSRFGPRYGQFGSTEETKLRGRMLNDLYVSVPTIVGDSLCLNREQSTYWSDRVYETTGRGGLLIMPQINALELEDQFDGYMPMWNWDDWDMMQHEVEYYLANRDEARDLGKLLQNIVKERHTYRHRINKVLKTVWG
jgi:hypothetical protein